MNSKKKNLKNLVFNSLRKLKRKYKIYKSYAYDAKRYILYSNTLEKDANRKSLVATILKAYHVVEKGLTMPEMRMGFGQEKIIFLIRKCQDYKKNFETYDRNVENAIKVILEYSQVHKDLDFKLSDALTKEIEDLKLDYPDLAPSKQEEIRVETTENFDSLSFRDFANLRSSLRNFGREDIPIEKFKEAVEIARNAPSACNRQPSRVHLFSDKEQIKAILSLQNGNNGFGHLANKLIILTADLNGYHQLNERYMNWVDGGIYLMNLVYALQFFKIGTCILNWGVGEKIDRKIRQVAGIDNNESVIALIACGYYPDKTISVASSPKRRVEEVLTVH